MPKTAEMPRLRMQGQPPKLAECGPHINKLSIACETRNVSIDAIQADPDLQSRARLDPALLKAYAERYVAGDEFPPIDLFYEDEVHRIGDGNMRFAAQRLANRTEVRARVFRGGREDALLYAAGANARHGAKRTRADKRRAVQMVMEHPDGKKWGKKRIAEWCGIDDHTAKAYLQELGFVCDDTIEYQRAGQTVKRKATTRRAAKVATQGSTASGLAALPKGDDGETQNTVVPRVGEGCTDPVTEAADVVLASASNDVVDDASGFRTSGATPARTAGQEAFARLYFAVTNFDVDIAGQEVRGDQRLREQAAQLIPLMRGTATKLSEILSGELPPAQS